MTKEGKIILVIIVGTILLFGGLAYLMTKSSSGGGKDSFILNSPAQGLVASPSGSMDLGDVPYGGGIISKTFDIKNSSDNAITLRKITTSCMCTTAKFSIDGKESKFYGMEMNGDLNPIIDYEVPADATAQVTFDFDPAAHGPQGIGPFDRVITLFFDNGYEELKFNGKVVN